jgi:hypothetical protein
MCLVVVGYRGFPAALRCFLVCVSHRAFLYVFPSAHCILLAVSWSIFVGVPWLLSTTFIVSSFADGLFQAIIAN